MSKLRKDYLVTFGSEMLVMVGVILLFKVAAGYWGVGRFCRVLPGAAGG